jgi:CelD/BcsL family acetyltransferase involved in cellulose biosynthesis
MNKGDCSISAEYSVKKVTDLNEFERLRTIWDNLAAKQDGYMAFLCFDWFKVWVDNFLNESKLLILLLYKGDEIVAIAPCFVKKVKYKGINVKKIELIGNVHSPFRFFLFRELGDEERTRGISFFFQFLVEDYKNWDVLDLSGIPEEERCFDVLKMAIEQRRLKYTDFVCYGDWYLDGIECSGDEFFSNLPQKIRKDVVYCRRRLENMGNFEFKLVTDGDMIDHYMDHYYGVYGKSWQEREGIGPNFHRDLAKTAAGKGWLRLGFLYFGGSPIASQYWLSCNHYAFILKTVYDQDYKKYSPGKILTSEMVKYVINADKVKTIDYVQGDEPYKQDWTPNRRERKGVEIFNGTLKGKMLAFLMIKVLPAIEKHPYLFSAKNKLSRYLRRHRLL